jgi:hypothetical protein
MRNMRLRVARKRVQMLSSDTASRGSDDVKTIVRDALLTMTGAEQVEFIQALAELTPTEVGHLVRFLKMHVLQAVTAVERAMARLQVLREKGDTGHALAA